MPIEPCLYLKAESTLKFTIQFPYHCSDLLMKKFRICFTISRYHYLHMVIFLVSTYQFLIHWLPYDLGSFFITHVSHRLSRSFLVFCCEQIILPRSFSGVILFIQALPRRVHSNGEFYEAIYRIIFLSISS